MKIKVAKVVGKKSFLIKGSEIDSNTDLYINKEVVPNELKRLGMTIKESDVVEFLPRTKTLLGYEKGSVFLSIEDYKSKPQSYDRDSGEEQVLRAIANRKELEGFEPKYKEIEFEPVELEIYGNVQETNSDFILCAVTGRWDKEPILYTLDVNRITIDEYKKIRTEHSNHAKFEDLDRNYLRFAKINDSYCFGDRYPFCEIRNEKIFTSLEEATNEESKIRADVKKTALQKIFPNNIDGNKKIIILSHLKAIKKAKTKLVMDEMLQILITDLQDYQKGIELKSQM